MLESRDDRADLQQVFFYDCEISEVEGSEGVVRAPLSRSEDDVKWYLTYGVPAGGEGPYIACFDLEASGCVCREMLVGIADSLGDPRGDGGRLDLPLEAWLVG